MAKLPNGMSDAPLEARWPTLMIESRFWSDGAIATEYARGVLSLALAKQLYGTSPENHHYTMALIDRVHDVDWVISCMGDKIFDL
ncbi:hypothetical protein BHE74_00056577 [Ensete ventricosum]|nr:hypothetical protein BHE74_00056577 [Ensete ventricosum]